MKHHENRIYLFMYLIVDIVCLYVSDRFIKIIRTNYSTLNKIKNSHNLFFRLEFFTRALKYAWIEYVSPFWSAAYANCTVWQQDEKTTRAHTHSTPNNLHEVHIHCKIIKIIAFSKSSQQHQQHQQQKPAIICLFLPLVWNLNYEILYEWT